MLLWNAQRVSFSIYWFFSFFFFAMIRSSRLHGSYEALKYGTLLDGLADLTGGITESINIRQDSTTCGRMLNKLLDMTSLVTCTVQASTTPQVRHRGVIRKADIADNLILNSSFNDYWSVNQLERIFISFQNDNE